MWNQYLSKINVRFFKDDGTPDVETAKKIYDEFQEIIDADYEGLKVKDGVITSNGYFYDDGVGACMTIVDCFAKESNYKGLYYVLEEGEEVGSLYPFCSKKMPGSYGFLIRDIVSDDGELLNTKQCFFDIDEDGKETLEDYSFADTECTEIYPKKWDEYKRGYPVESVPEGTVFYPIKLSDFKNALIKLGLNKCHFTEWEFGEITLNIHNNLATFISGYTLDHYSVQIKTEPIPDMRISMKSDYFFYILENASNNGYISIACIENKELSEDWQKICNMYFKFDDKLIGGTARVNLKELKDLSYQSIEESRKSFICNRMDLINALEDIYRTCTPKVDKCYTDVLDKLNVKCTASLKEQQLSLLLEFKKKYPIYEDIHEERKILIQNTSDKEEIINFEFQLASRKILRRLSAESIALLAGNRNDNVYGIVIEPLPKSELLEYCITC